MNHFDDSDLNDIDFNEVDKAFSDILTPTEYNGGQLDKLQFPDDLPYSVGIDWCELSLRGDLSYLDKSEEYAKNDYKLVRLDIRSRHFNSAFSVYYLNDLFGTIFFSPRSKVIPVEVIQFKIDNQHFYKAGRHRLNFAITHFLTEFDVTFNNFTRLDIYIDFYKFNNNLSFEDFAHRYSVGQIDTKGKISKYCPYYTKIDGKMKLTGWSMGSRSSDKFIRCYNKSAEILLSHKDYIREYWNKNKMDLPADVYRFELQLTSKWFREVKPFKLVKDDACEISTEKIITNLLSISSKDSLLNLLELGLKNYFDFYLEDERKKRNDDKIPFMIFDWNQIRKGATRVYEYVRQKLRHQKFTWRQKMIIVRNLYREYIINFQDAGWLKYVARVVWDYNLIDRWDKMKERYTKEFLQTLSVHYDWDNSKFNTDWATHYMNFRISGITEQLTLFKKEERVKHSEKYYTRYPHLRLYSDGSVPVPPVVIPVHTPESDCPF